MELQDWIKNKPLGDTYKVVINSPPKDERSFNILLALCEEFFRINFNFWHNPLFLKDSVFTENIINELEASLLLFLENQLQKNDTTNANNIIDVSGVFLTAVPAIENGENCILFAIKIIDSPVIVNFVIESDGKLIQLLNIHKIKIKKCCEDICFNNNISSNWFKEIVHAKRNIQIVRHLSSCAGHPKAVFSLAKYVLIKKYEKLESSTSYITLFSILCTISGGSIIYILNT